MKNFAAMPLHQNFVLVNARGFEVSENNTNAIKPLGNRRMRDRVGSGIGNDTNEREANCSIPYECPPSHPLISRLYAGTFNPACTAVRALIRSHQAFTPGHSSNDSMPAKAWLLSLNCGLETLGTDAMLQTHQGKTLMSAIEYVPLPGPARYCLSFKRISRTL